MSTSEWEKIKGKRVVAADARERYPAIRLLFEDGTTLIVWYSHQFEELVVDIANKENDSWELDFCQ